MVFAKIEIYCESQIRVFKLFGFAQASELVEGNISYVLYIKLLFKFCCLKSVSVPKEYTITSHENNSNFLDLCCGR